MSPSKSGLNVSLFFSRKPVMQKKQNRKEHFSNMLIQYWYNVYQVKTMKVKTVIIPSNMRDDEINFIFVMSGIVVIPRVREPEVYCYFDIHCLCTN